MTQAPAAAPGRQLAVVGAGWAGLAAAVEAVQRGWQVQLFDMARQPGGRARTVADGHGLRDNGQHILIGAYRDTLALMRQVGVDTDTVLRRLPLTLMYPDGTGLQLSHGPGPLAFARAVLAARGWSWSDRLRLLAACTGWMAQGFRCDPALTVAQWSASLPPAVLRELVAPLSVAALNTPAESASASVLLRVLHDALFGGTGSADLLLPTRPLSQLLPEPALRWLARQGVACHLGHRVHTLEPAGAGWRVDGQPFAAVVLACPPAEAARLVQPLQPGWAETAQSLRYEPIITVWLREPGLRLPHPMMALHEGPQAPAQFIFDLGALGQRPGEFSCVVSGAATWIERGLAATGQAVLQQLRQALGPGRFQSAQALVQVAAERRATFACTPGLLRPPAVIAPRLVAAGDHVQGPYPATLEGAVRSGRAAAQHLGRADRAGRG